MASKYGKIDHLALHLATSGSRLITFASWIDKKMSSDIHYSQRMNPNDFVDNSSTSMIFTIRWTKLADMTNIISAKHQHLAIVMITNVSMLMQGSSSEHYCV